MIRTSIKQPNNLSLTTNNGKTKMVWNDDFAQNWGSLYGKVQMFVDSEVLRLSEKYIPMDTGMLRRSGQLGTKIGNGLVEYIAPYARAQYYMPQPYSDPTLPREPLQGAYWFERMKQAHGRGILEGARRMMRGGSH